MFYKKSSFAIAFVLFLFVFNAVFAQDLDSLNNKKNVKSIHAQMLIPSNIVQKKGKIISFDTIALKENIIYYYDTMGNLLSDFRYSKDGQPVEGYNYTYNAKNQLLEKQRTFNQTLYGGKTIYSYKNNGTLLYSTIYDADNNVYRYIGYVYEDNRLIKEEIFNSARIVIANQEFKYDENGRIIEFINNDFYKKDKNYSYKQFYKDSLLIRKEYFGADGELLLFWIYLYDEKNRLIEEKQYDYEETMLTAEYKTYDKIGNMIVNHRIDTQISKRMKMVYTYWSDGNYKSLKVYIDDSKRPQYYKECFYDERGNWILWKESDNNRKIIAIGCRSIEYFD